MDQNASFNRRSEAFFDRIINLFKLSFLLEKEVDQFSSSKVH